MGGRGAPLVVVWTPDDHKRLVADLDRARRADAETDERRGGAA